jgi:hypothetical protein
MPASGIGASRVVCSADGTRLAAVGGAVFTSKDSGATWKPGTVPSGFWSWDLIVSSADGTRLATEEIDGSPVFVILGAIIVSDDSGASWVQAPTSGLTNYYTFWSGIAISADGCKLAAAVGQLTGLGYPFSGNIFTLQFTPAPALAIASSSGQLVLSWTVPSMNFVLQQNHDLATTNWTDVAGKPVLDYSTLRNQVAIPPPPGTMFYRLVSR